MATNHDLGPLKIDSNKLSFFDLPAEVREQVYEQYFLLFGDFTIHLLNVDANDTYHFVTSVRKAIVSREHRVHLESRIRRDPEQHQHVPNETTVESLTSNVAQLNLDQSTTQDLIAQGSPGHLIWTRLEAASKALRGEARRHSYNDNRFKVLNGGYGCHDVGSYHDRLEFIPQPLLWKIKNLELDQSLVNETFNVMHRGWDIGLWFTLLTSMVNLQNLWISNLDLSKICSILQLLTMREA